jgi:hypothetical protein
VGGASILLAFLGLWQFWALAGEVGQAEAGEGALNAGVAKMRGRPRGGAHGWLDRPPFPVHWRR